MRAAQTAASVYQSSGNLERALALHREIVSIADLTLRANDPQRGFVRINAAIAYAHARRFDEAERLAAEAQTPLMFDGFASWLGGVTIRLTNLWLLSMSKTRMPAPPNCK